MTASRISLFVLLVLACSPRKARNSKLKADAGTVASWRGSGHNRDAIEAGLAYLLRRQSPDGSFRSTTYSSFRDGYAVTALVAMPIYFLRANRAGRAYERAVDFIATLVKADGGLDDRAAYSTYAIALTILALKPQANSRHHDVRDRLIEHLLARQLTERNGWPTMDASFGGWGYHAGVPVYRERSLSRMPMDANLSMTVFAIGALSLSAAPAAEAALGHARAFVERSQNFRALGRSRDFDGGFFFSPKLADGNKAGPLVTEQSDAKGLRYRSYGSMTADGLRGLLALGYPRDHPRVRYATEWLRRYFEPDRNPGDFPDNAEVRRHSAYYYYTWTVAHALRHLHDSARARQLAQSLLARQLPDGSWSNPYSEMREDDPLVATPFALAALIIADALERGEYRSHR